MSRTPKKWLLLPLETKARELDGKAFLAFEAAERGWGVILGRGIREKPYLPRGVFIENSIAPGRASDIVASHAQGRKVVAWCEEGVVYLNSEEYGRRRVERESFNMIDGYFAWGEHQASDLIHDLGCDASKIVVSGNPRFDLLRADVRDVFSERVRSIRERFGRFILVNTRFALYSNYLGEDFFIDSMRKKGKIKTPEQEALHLEYRDFQRRTFLAFERAVATLGQAYPDYTIVVRPHPSESHDPWNKLASQYSNIKVVFEGNVAEWILAAELCIHNNCTTAVEASLLERPTLSYRPFKDERFDTYLPNALSDQTETLEGLKDWVAKVLSGGDPTGAEQRKQRKAVLDTYISGQNSRTSSQIIVETLGGLELPAEPLRLGASARSHLKEKVLDGLRPMKRLLDSPKKAAKARYKAQKFPGLQLSEMREFLKDSQRATGRFRNVEVQQIDKDVMCIQAL